MRGWKVVGAVVPTEAAGSVCSSCLHNVIWGSHFNYEERVSEEVAPLKVVGSWVPHWFWSRPALHGLHVVFDKVCAFP